MRKRKRRRLKPRQQGEFMEQISIASIIVENRFRKDMGDLDALAASIAELGQLQPIIINKDRRLIAGGRRLAAMKQLGRETIAASVFDLDDLDALKVERDENDQRKPPTNSERVALAQAITAHEKWLAEQRKQASQFGGAGNISHTESAGRVSDILAQKVGLGSGKTLEAAQKVVERGIPELVEAMDSGKVTIHAAKNISTLPDEEIRALDYEDPAAVSRARSKASAREKRKADPGYGSKPKAQEAKEKPQTPEPDESRLYEEGSSVSAWVLAHQAKQAIRQISRKDPNAFAAIESILAVLESQSQSISRGN